MDKNIGYIITENNAVLERPEIAESNKDFTRIRTTLQDADSRNRNNRIYPKNVIEEGLKSEYVTECLRNKVFYGEAGRQDCPLLQ